MSSKKKKLLEVELSGNCEITSFEIVDGRSREGFPKQIYVVEYQKPKNGNTIGLIPETDTERFRGDSEVVRVYRYGIKGSWSGNYETHYNYGHKLIGLYISGIAVNELEDELFSKLAESQLPLEVKKVMGIKQENEVKA